MLTYEAFLDSIAEILANEYIPPSIIVDPLAVEAAIAYSSDDKRILYNVKRRWKRKYPNRPFLPREWWGLFSQ